MSIIRVPLTDTTLGEEEAQAAARVVRSGWVTMGAEVQAFEAEFAAALGCRHAIGITNGTAALHLAYQAAGLGQDDEFALPALTFVATLNAGLYLGGKPVLIDCASEDDLTISAADLARKVTPRTRLIVTMPYGGFCPDMQAIQDIAAEQNIPIVEDACHAPLAQIDGRMIGTFGIAGTYSFFGNKNLSVGEGGMVVTDSDDVAAHVRLMRAHGMTTLTWDRHRGHAASYDVVAAGYNYRLDEIRAAVGREQLKKLPGNNAARTKVALKMRERLETLGIAGFSLPFSRLHGVPAHHLCVALLPPGTDRDAFRAHLLERGIQTSVHYPPLHTFTHTKSLWADQDLDLPVLQKITDRLVTLPMGAQMRDEQVEWVAEAVGEFFA